MGNITHTYNLTDMNDSPPSRMINYAWLTSKPIDKMKPQMIPGSIFLIYRLEFHNFHFPNMSVLYQKPGIVRKKLEYTRENDQKKKDIRTNNGVQKN